MLWPMPVDTHARGSTMANPGQPTLHKREVRELAGLLPARRQATTGGKGGKCGKPWHPFGASDLSMISIIATGRFPPLGMGGKWRKVAESPCKTLREKRPLFSCLTFGGVHALDADSMDERPTLRQVRAMLDPAVKTKIMNEVDHRFDDQTKVLADLVKIPSTRFREAPAQDMMARLFKEDGLGGRSLADQDRRPEAPAGLLAAQPGLRRRLERRRRLAAVDARRAAR